MLNRKAQREIRRYLRAVRRHLGPGSETAATLRSMEEHIYSALQARFPESPTENDVRQVIDELEPPESFAQDAEGYQSMSAAAEAGYRYGKAALIVLLAAIVIPLALIIIDVATGFFSGLAAVPTLTLGLIIMVPLLTIALVLGIAGFRSSAGKAVVIIVAILAVLGSILIPVRATSGIGSGHQRNYIDRRTETLADSRMQ